MRWRPRIRTWRPAETVAAAHARAASGRRPAADAGRPRRRVGSTVKLVTVMPGNASRPAHHPCRGDLAGCRDGRAAGRLRRRHDHRHADRRGLRASRRDSWRGPMRVSLGLLGAGAQAAWQVRAVLAARPIEEVRVYARDESRRRAFADALAADLGPSVTVRAMPDVEATVRGSDVICAATTSSPARPRGGVGRRGLSCQRHRCVPARHG